MGTTTPLNSSKENNKNHHFCEFFQSYVIHQNKSKCTEENKNDEFSYKEKLDKDNKLSIKEELNTNSYNNNINTNTNGNNPNNNKNEINERNKSKENIGNISIKSTENNENEKKEKKEINELEENIEKPNLKSSEKNQNDKKNINEENSSIKNSSELFSSVDTICLIEKNYSSISSNNIKDNPNDTSNKIQKNLEKKGTMYCLDNYDFASNNVSEQLSNNNDKILNAKIQTDVNKKEKYFLLEKNNFKIVQIENDKIIIVNEENNNNRKAYNKNEILDKNHIISIVYQNNEIKLLMPIIEQKLTVDNILNQLKEYTCLVEIINNNYNIKLNEDELIKSFKINNNNILYL